MMTKTEYATEKLKKRILSGEFRPGQKIPSMRDLAEEYGVSTMVLRKVAEKLEEEGLLESTTRSGLFIPRNLKQHELCGLITSVQMGTMENYFEAFLERASAHNSITMVSPCILSSIESMLEKGLRRLFVSLDSCLFPFERLRELTRGFNTVFCNQFEWLDQEPESAVLADWVYMTEQTLRTFLAAGHERILFISYKEPLPEFKRRQFQEAAKRVGLEFESPEFQWCSRFDFENRPDRLKKLFRENPAPTAAFARGDSLLYHFRERLDAYFPESAGIDMIGTYNSFWSNYPGKAFASWEWNWNEFWDMVFEHKGTGVEYYRPTLVKRNPKRKTT